MEESHANPDLSTSSVERKGKESDRSIIMKYVIAICIAIVSYIILSYDDLYILIHNQNISPIPGSWKKSATEIVYENGTLCAKLLRAGQFNTNDATNLWYLYGSSRSCINVHIRIDDDNHVRYVNDDNVSVCLKNNNGVFENETDISSCYKNYTYMVPQGSWSRFAKSVTYYPNRVCAHFLKEYVEHYLLFFDSNIQIYKYNESCIDFEHDDRLVNFNGQFRKYHELRKELLYTS